MYPNRFMCDALEEMRSCWKTRNFAPMLGLIEEIQTMGNRMEAALQDVDDVDEMRKERNDLYYEIRKLRKERNGEADGIRQGSAT